jgi:hypothetical protein
VNGSLVESFSNIYKNYDVNRFEIGALLLFSNQTNFFSGNIDDVRIWNVAKSDSEINNNFNSELTGSESNLVAYYNMNQGTGSTLSDNQTSGTNTLTLNNTSFSSNVPFADTSIYGDGSWIGYVYTHSNSGAPSPAFTSQQFKGSTTENETFNQNWNSSGPTINSTTYSDFFHIRYKMNKNFAKGKYNITIGGDDGIRLSVDGGSNYLITDWNDHGYRTSSMNNVILDGSTNLVLDFYENGGGAQASFAYTPVCYYPNIPLLPTTSSVDQTSASLSWGANGNAGTVTYYWVLKNESGTTVQSGNTTSTSVSVTSLASNTNYYFTVYGNNDCGASAVATSGTITTLASTPTTQASSIIFSSISSTEMTIGWTIGNGTNRAVFVKAGTGAITNPTDNTTYTASANWSSKGTQLSSSGYYCVYNGSGNSVTLSGLAAGNQYTVQIFEYSNAASKEKYYTATATNNPKSQTTLALPTIAATTSATAISAISATSGGNISADGGASITARGVCWGTSSNPELGENNFTTNGTGIGSFTSAITGLTAGTVYYVRAYATNSVGTNYGTQISFTYTNADKSLTDIADPTVSDIAVANGFKFTSDLPAKTVNSVTVEPGGKVVLNNALTVNGNVTLKADDNSSFSATVGSGMAVSGIVRYVKTITKGKWYFISFPCEVAQSDITYAATGATLGNFGDGDAFDWDVEYYDGAARALNKQTDSRNWKTIGSGNPLEAYKGYIFWVNGSGTADIAFKLNNSLVLSEGQTNVPVAQCGTANTIHDGWNLIGQPYLSKYAGGNAAVTYMTFPNSDGGLTYTTVHKSENENKGRIVDPFTAYFVQVAADGTIPFYTSGRQAAPASVAAEVSDILQLNFTTPTGTDNTNLVMDNDQSTSYKIGEDMVKWLGTGTAKPQVYTIIGGVNYAYNGLPITSVVNLPLGIYTQTAGTSTISVDATSAPSLSQLLLTDKTTGTVTNLLTSSYSFNASAGTNNTRFTITAQRISTESTIENETDGPTVLINNLELIINNLNGKTNVRVFDAIGRMVVSKTTNNSSIEIPLSAQGIYTVQMESGAKSWVRKVVISR